MSAAGTDPNPEKALEPQPDEGTTSTLAGQVQPEREGGQMPYPQPVSELTFDEYMDLPWVVRMFEDVHESRLKQDMKEFSKEFLRLSQGRWARLNDIPYWKIALGREEEKLVDEVLADQREKEYTEPHAIACTAKTVKFLRIARDLLEAHRGCSTPAEEFIWSLLISANVRPLTPDDAEDSLKEFRDNFETAKQTTRYFCHQYPDLAQEGPANE